MPCVSPLKGFVNKENGGITFKRSSIAGAEMEVACGQCLGCRLDHSRMWAIRMMHEAQCWEENCFITLTYNDQHLPSGGTLVKAHFQKFMKRLRKRFPAKKIRYYHCGEYGDQFDRPHYHACLFNFIPHDLDFFREDQGNLLFTSELLEKVWGKGFVTVGELSFQSAAYCARYVLKKVNGHKADSHYERFDPTTGVVYNLEPEYTTMSRRPGIGRTWYEKYKTDVFPSDEVPVSGVGVLKKVPRYYETILAAEDPDQHEQIKKLRKVYRDSHADEFTPERLMSKYKIMKAQKAMLKRERSEQ